MNLIFTLFAICGFLGLCSAAFDCSHKYRVINTFEDLTRARISCYETNNDCEILYSQDGYGCDENAVQIATVAANESAVVKYNFDFGGAICSSYQIDVNIWRKNIVSQWPRATDAGLKFGNIFWNPQGLNLNFRIAYSALSSAATITYTSDGLNGNQILTVEPFSTKIIDENLDIDLQRMVTLSSDVPIIVTYSDYKGKSDTFHVWQPVSSEPIFTYVRAGYFLGYQEFSCNDLSLGTNDAKIQLGNVGEVACSPQNQYVFKGKVESYGGNCTVLLTPSQPGFCVSTSIYASPPAIFVIQDMAIVFNKLPRSFMSYKVNAFPLLLSDAERPCRAATGDDFEKIELKSVGQDLDGQFFYGKSLTNVKDIERIDCSENVFISVNGTYEQNFISSGLSFVELWTDYFDSIGCPLPSPLPVPTEAPTPAPTGAPLIPILPSFTTPTSPPLIPILPSFTTPSASDTPSSGSSTNPSPSSSHKIFSISMSVTSLGILCRLFKF